MKKKKVLFVFGADRGHFMFSLPLAESITNDATVDVEVEYITHEQSVNWIPTNIKSHDTLGRFNKELVNTYVELSCHGNTRKEGNDHAMKHMDAELKKNNINPELTTVTTMVKKTDDSFYSILRFKGDIEDKVVNMINQEDVIGVVCEMAWTRHTYEICKELGKPCLIIAPTPLGLHLYENALKETLPSNNNPSLHELYNNPNQRYTQQEIKEFAKIIGYEDSASSPVWDYPQIYTLALPLRLEYERYLPNDIGSKWIGAVLRDYHNPITEPDLEAFLAQPYQFNNDDNDDDNDTNMASINTSSTNNINNANSRTKQQPSQQLHRDVIYFSLGSHMLLKTLPRTTIKNFIEGIFDVRFEVPRIVGGQTKRQGQGQRTDIKDEGEEDKDGQRDDCYGEVRKIKPLIILVADAKGKELIFSLGIKDEVLRNKKRLFVTGFAPQWDLLHHPRLSCFVTHCGANSIHESLANGIPTIGCPFFDDQYGNASASEKAGCSVLLNKNSTKSEVFEAVSKVGAPASSFRAAAKKWQKIVLEENALGALKSEIYSWM